MTVINTNTASINAQYNLNKVNKEMESAMEALSSGKRINSAADDAAGMSIATRMESQVRGLNQAMRNAADGQNMLATAEGAMDEITNMLQRMRELSLQAASDTMNTQDRSNLNNEMEQLKTEIDRIVENTRYNDQLLLDGTQQGTTFQIGAKSGEALSFNIANMSTSSLGTTSSSVSGTASLEASAQGTAAVENVVNMTFNGNGNYAFTVTLDGKSATGGTQEQISIDADVIGFSAKEIAQDINDKIALTSSGSERDLTGILSATYSGNTVSIVNKEGTSVDIGSFVAQGSNTAIVNPVTNPSVESKTLESVTELDTLANSGGETAVASKATLQLEIGKKFSFELNNTLIEVDTTTDGLAAAGKTLAQALTALDDAITDAIDLTSGTGNATVSVVSRASDAHMTIEMQDATGADISVSAFNKQSVRAVDDSFITFNADVTGTTTSTIAHNEFMTADLSNTGTELAIATGKTGRIQFGNQELANSFSIDWTAGTVNGVVATAAATYTVDITADFDEELDRIANQISQDGGLNVTAVNNGGSIEINNQSTGAVTFAQTTAISAEGFDAVTEGTAHIWSDVLASEAVTDDDDISDETGASSLVDGSVYHVSNGTEAEASVMALTFDSDDRYSFQIQGTANADITADVSGGSLTAMMNVVNSYSSTTDVTASIDSGSLLLTKADGTAFTIDNFSAEANGKATAANAAGQGGSALLENAGTSASMAIGASGAAVATTMELSFSGDDKYSFKISDGTSTATVRATATVNDTDADADTAALLAEIQLALDSANMSHVKATSATGDNGTITLTNELGGKIDITNFTSDEDGTMTASPSVGQGVGKILNDNIGTDSEKAVASINALTSSSASLAIEAVDRALENINSARSELGALSNRLDHTISNLGNVVVNTEASQSRIEDADFAATTGELTKAQIMSQAATAMLAQANASKQGVLSLLQG